MIYISMTYIDVGVVAVTTGVHTQTDSHATKAQFSDQTFLSFLFPFYIVLFLIR